MNNMVLVAVEKGRKKKGKPITVNAVNKKLKSGQSRGLDGELSGNTFMEKSITQESNTNLGKSITQLADKYASEIEKLVGENREEFDIMLFALKGSCQCPTCNYIRVRLEDVITKNINKIKEIKEMVK